MTCILHTARISNVDSTVCDNKERSLRVYFFFVMYVPPNRIQSDLYTPRSPKPSICQKPWWSMYVLSQLRRPTAGKKAIRPSTVFCEI